MCAGVTESEGPALYYVDSDGTRLSGNLFCVGSGQTFAYGVLDAEYHYDLTASRDPCCHASRCLLRRFRKLVSCQARRLGQAWVQRYEPSVLGDEVKER